MKNILPVVFMLLAHTLSALNPYCIGDTLHCLAQNGLKLRDSPKGKAIATILLGEKLVVEAVTPSSDRYDDIAGTWVKVQYKSQTGYVFDGYLSKLPAPELSDTTFHTYLARTFLKIGKPAKIEYPCGRDEPGESSYSATIELFQYGNFVAKHIDYMGWEWGHETITLDYITMEEVYLICKVVYKNDIADIPFAMPKDSVNEENPTIRVDFMEGYENPYSEYLTIAFSDNYHQQVIISRVFGL